MKAIIENSSSFALLLCFVFRLGNFLKKERCLGLTTLKPATKPLIGFSMAKI